MVRRRPPPKGANVAVIEGSLGSQGYLDRMFAVCVRTGITFGILVEMDDPEIDLRFSPPGVGSYTGTSGELCQSDPGIPRWVPGSFLIRGAQHHWCLPASGRLIANVSISRTITLQLAEGCSYNQPT